MNGLIAATMFLIAQQPAQAPPVNEQPPLHYHEAIALSLKTGKPLVTFVGRKTIASLNDVAVVTGMPSGEFREYPERCVIVGIPYTDGKVHWKDTLPTTATENDIRRALGVEPREASYAQLDYRVRSAWPRGLEFLDDLRPYRRATKTQESGNRSGNGANFIRDRTVLPMKWQVPGGLEGVQGWTSTLYQSARARNWFGHVDPNDSPVLGVWGSEITHQRLYDDGAVFADVLRNDRNEVFEVRVSEKQAGEWQRYVAYQDKAARPSGYVRPTSRQCIECHALAGTGGYGVALIPGGDTILSDPLPAIESGSIPSSPSTQAFQADTFSGNFSAPRGRRR